MSDRATTARRAAERLRAFDPATVPATLGFDGFVDAIIDVVESRPSVDRYQPYETIAAFGKRVTDSAGKSNNFELVTRLQKLGGNGPIMANAMAGFGVPVTYVGALGRPDPHPAFEELHRKADCISLSDPGFTDALEFTDGKLMLGKYGGVEAISPATIDRVIGRENFIDLVRRSRLLVMVNWTMVTGMTDIFRMLADEVLPAFDERPLLFVDLCDPSKRTRDDLAAALALLGEMQTHAEVMLGLNLAEAVQVAQVLDIDPTDQPQRIIEDLASAIRQTLAIHAVTVHPREDAAAAIRDGDAIDSASLTGAFVKNPKLSTGAGDNYNAGFCLGVLAGLGAAESVCVGNAASGFYVRNARSATMEELAAFLDNLPEAEVD